MSYRWVPHTAELELELDAPSEEEIFADALRALGELLGGPSTGPPTRIELALSGGDRAVLLTDFIDELVFQAETEDLVPSELARIELTADALAASVVCRPGAPPHIVKGATYHRLAFGRDRSGVHARVVLDV